MSCPAHPFQLRSNQGTLFVSVTVVIILRANKGTWMVRYFIGEAVPFDVIAGRKNSRNGQSSSSDTKGEGSIPAIV